MFSRSGENRGQVIINGRYQHKKAGIVTTTPAFVEFLTLIT
ncbi:hypothetical protein CLV42_10749 [Chitinophaga ginsengisoli]|uniref:Uncharacterized protein n=1 Tax=Chitinophaga ginsengisoli TaxID=363837 RepID=A0A2P8G4K3_9BACT|nr:hypothetical protein CLV42_10749 [Chitinophaga ginsengisoli]